MIALSCDTPLLRRFASELAATTPRPIPARPTLAGYADVDIEAARLAWTARIVDEYRSVAVFSELLGLLADLEAPFPALCAVQRIIGDELRHTELTATVVEWLGGSADLGIDLRAIGLPPREPDESPAQRALRIVARELVVAEEESVHVLCAYRDATREPALRAVLDIVLVDEVRHAAAGRALLALWPDADLREEMAADRAELRGVYAGSTADGPGRELGACITLADLERYWSRASIESGRARQS